MRSLASFFVYHPFYVWGKTHWEWRVQEQEQGLQILHSYCMFCHGKIAICGEFELLNVESQGLKKTWALRDVSNSDNAIELPDWLWVVRHTTNFVFKQLFQTHFKWCVVGGEVCHYKPICHCLFFLTMKYGRLFGFRLPLLLFLQTGRMSEGDGMMAWCNDGESCELYATLSVSTGGLSARH